MTIEELGKHCVIIDFSDLFTKSVTNIYYKQGEVGTASIKAKLVKKRTPIDLTGCRVILNIMTEKGEPIVDTATILDAKEGIVEIRFEQVALNTGISFFELTIMDEHYNTKKSPKIAYRVLDSLSEDAVIESERFPILVNMIKDVDDLHTHAESLVSETTQLRQQVIELNETMTQAESVRNSNEETRKSNESARESSESTRNNNETTRQADETTRQNNETKRQESETQRQSEFSTLKSEMESSKNEIDTLAESVRQEEEKRKSSEDTRVSSETERQNNETQRQSDENTRKLQESSRVQADIERQNGFNSKIGEVNERLETIDRAITAGTQDLEVKEARDGEVSLKARLERDLYKDGKPLKECVSDIEGLKESQDMQYETDKGYLICEETQNGVVKDLKIKGKTLVNLFNNSTAIVQADSNRLRCANAENINMYKPTIYTLVNLSDKVIEPNVWKQSVAEFIRTISLQANEVTTVTLGSDECIREVVWNYSRGWTEGDLEKAKKSFVILEGDHTQNSLNGYIDGLQSVGEDVDKIEVLTRKEDGNLIDDVIKPNALSDVFIPKGSYVASCKATSGVIRYYRQDGSSIDYWSLQGEGIIYRAFTTNEDIYKILFDVSEDATELQIIQGAEPTPYEPYKAHKKEILYKDTDDTYKPVPVLREWDEIDDTKGKWFKRSGKVVLNGSEEWSMPTNISQPNTIAFITTATVGRKPDILNIVCDKFSTVDVYNQDAEGTRGYTSSSNVLVRISKSKLETQDVAGFKKWLQANPVTVVYQLAEEQVYDIAPINLDAYSNKTMVCCSSGAISPHMSFAITSYISNLVLSNKERIKSLEDKFTEMFKRVLSGDVQSLAYMLYPDDFKHKSDIVEDNKETKVEK